MIAGDRFSTTEQSKSTTQTTERDLPEPTTGAATPVEIRIAKALVPAEVDGRETTVQLFTMSLGDESIYLVPQKTWSQMDVFKWRVQGKLPGTPAGLEITFDHVKLGDETVSIIDPDAPEKLERAFNKWLAFERQALELAAQKAQTSTAQVAADPQPEEAFRFEVGLDKSGQPRIRCMEGKETVADVALTVPGLSSLITQGLMRKPSSWKIGALRNWVELDGDLIKFADNAGELTRLEKVLNERYAPAPEAGAPPDVEVFENPASATGFDIQFPAVVNGLAEHRRRHLNPEAMELLSDPYRCRVLRKGIVVKLTPPNFIFKQKLPDGGERPLEPGPENTVSAAGTDGMQKWIDLSEPVSHLGLGAAELMAVFNHPSINRRAKMNEQAQAGVPGGPH